MMKRGWWGGCCALAFLGSSAFAGHALGADVASAAPAATQSAHGFDWIEHTQHTLDELKRKLSLGSDQAQAWETWSRGVLEDAHRQLDARRLPGERHAHRAEPGVEETTPERMSAGIEQLRTEIHWMQERLAQLEAALVRTNAFYGVLDPKQKIIFDLYWHEIQHRASGHDDGWEMHGHHSPMADPMSPRRDAPGRSN